MLPAPPPPPPPSETPTSLERARRARAQAANHMTPGAVRAAVTGQPSVAAADVVALLNRIGECVRVLPSFGRTRTQTSAVLAKRTLSAISTCSPSRLADDDPLRAVLARLDTTREALRETVTTGVERIAIARRLGELQIPLGAGSEDRVEHGLPAHTYLLCGGHVVRQPGDHPDHDGPGDDGHWSVDERIDDLARAGALIAAEIDRLQQLGERRYA